MEHGNQSSLQRRVFFEFLCRFFLLFLSQWVFAIDVPTEPPDSRCTALLQQLAGEWEQLDCRYGATEFPRDEKPNQWQISRVSCTLIRENALLITYHSESDDKDAALRIMRHHHTMIQYDTAARMLERYDVDGFRQVAASGALASKTRCSYYYGVLSDDASVLRWYRHEGKEKGQLSAKWVIRPDGTLAAYYIRDGRAEDPESQWELATIRRRVK